MRIGLIDCDGHHYMKEPKIVVYAGNRNVYTDMLTAAKSLLMNNQIDRVYFVIEDDDFPAALPDCIETINVKEQTLFPPSGANTKTRFSYICLMRAVYADLFFWCDKILSLDIDTIVTGDISALWDINLDDYYFAAVPEPSCTKNGRNKKTAEFYEKQDDYFNAGVMMYNLKKQREDGIAEMNVKLLNEREFFSIEQDTFNLTCQGCFYTLPNEYNSSGWTGRAEKPLIVHYAGIRLEQWRKELIPRSYGEIPMDFAKAVNKRLSKKPKKREERIVVYSGTRNLYGDMVTAVKSLLSSTYVDKVYLLIEDDEIDGIPDDVDCIDVLNVADQPYFPLDSPNAQTILTYMVLMRCAYHKLFEHKTVLSLDVDTVIVRDISGIWDADMSDYYIAAAKEPICSKGGQFEKRDEYYNMGVCLMNLEKLRDGTGDKIIETVNSGKTEAQEQGVFNELCTGKILQLPNTYNSGNPWTGDSVLPKIIHFAGDRHWQSRPELRAYRNLAWSEIMEKQRKWRDT